MKSRPLSCLLFGAAFLLTVPLCSFAQDTNDPVRVETGRVTADRTTRGSIRGRVVLPSGRLIDESLKVTLLTVNGTQAWTYTENQGWFEFLNLTPGNYEVQIESSGANYQVVSQAVQVLRGAPSMVTISLRDSSEAKPKTASSVVSVNELSAAIPKTARKEFMLASEAVRNHKTDEAITHLRKAIDIYPAFAMARSDLGTQLLAQGKLDEAEEELGEAIKIDGAAFNPRLNLGIVLVEKHDFGKGIEELSRAISLNPESPAAQLYAGIAYAAVAEYDEAEKHLKAAYTIGGTSYSMALFHLGQLYMNKGNRDAALKYFQTYLQVAPDAPNAQQVEKLIAMLR
jgi:tetratricopeptide (TPR) repeat protein